MAALTKTVAILGVSYGGSGAVRKLVDIIPKDWRIVLIDRNTHMNHLYVLPRLAVIPGHEYKAFIPYDRLLEDPSSDTGKRHLLLHAQVTSMTPNELTLSRSFPDLGIDNRLHFDYLIYALGSHLPAPINLWGPVDQSVSLGLAPVAKAPTDANPRDALESSTSVPQDVPPNVPTVDQLKLAPIAVGTKPGGIEWLKRFQKQVKSASSVLVVGGGALGIQYSLDIAEVYPNKRVTLLHSRAKLLPRFDDAMHTEIISSLWAANVNVILGERLDLASVKAGKFTNRADGTLERIVTTEGGREIQAELILLCTGQTPNTTLLGAILPESIVTSGPNKDMIRVQRTLQVAVPKPGYVAGCEGEGDPELTVPYPHIFAIGDAADAYGAINAGHNAYGQGRLAAENIVRLIEGKTHELARYEPGPPAIKVSLGLARSLYQSRGVVGTRDNALEDLDAGSMWEFYGYAQDEETMRQ